MGELGMKICLNVCINIHIFVVLGVEEVDIGPRSAQKQGEYKCFKALF
jgi:hypothetical protein